MISTNLIWFSRSPENCAASSKFLVLLFKLKPPLSYWLRLTRWHYNIKANHDNHLYEAEGVWDELLVYKDIWCPKMK
jgi:hypothetical protein